MATAKDTPSDPVLRCGGDCSENGASPPPGETAALRPHYRNALALLIAFWERLRASRALKGLFLFAVVAVIALAAATLPTADESPFADAERFSVDQQTRLVRQVHPRALAADTV